MNTRNQSGLNQSGTPNRLDALDEMLLEQETLLPTSGFALSVMEAIRQQECQQAAIPFPWKFAAPAIAAWLAAAVFLLRIRIADPASGQSQTPPWLSNLHAQISFPSLSLDPGRLIQIGQVDRFDHILRTEITPVLLALAASALCLVLCHRMVNNWTTR